MVTIVRTDNSLCSDGAPHDRAAAGKARIAPCEPSNENAAMKRKTAASEETPEQAAEAIAAALDFLQAEAEAAGLSESAALIRQASARAREHRGATLSTAPAVRGVNLPDACYAIAGLPAEYRQALVFRKVYRRSYEQIAEDCSVSVATAKDRVIKGFKLVRISLHAHLAR